MTMSIARGEKTIKEYAMEVEEEFEYEQDYPYCDEEIMEQYPTDEEDYNAPHSAKVAVLQSTKNVC